MKVECLGSERSAETVSDIEAGMTCLLVYDPVYSEDKNARVS